VPSDHDQPVDRAVWSVGQDTWGSLKGQQTNQVIDMLAFLVGVLHSMIPNVGQQRLKRSSGGDYPTFSSGTY